jgi:hypothetical protein
LHILGVQDILTIYLQALFLQSFQDVLEIVSTPEDREFTVGAGLLQDSQYNLLLHGDLRYLDLQYGVHANLLPCSSVR